LAPGSKPLTPTAVHRARGFTLLELMLVVALLAVAAGLTVLAMRDGNASRLDEEAVRLSALLEGARARSRALGLEVRWLPQGAEGTGFQFSGLPANSPPLPSAWLDERTRAEVIGAPLLRLGPEPVIGAQRVVLRLADRQLVLATNGLAPFAVLESGAVAPAP
jgi:general secretion pathway protein H